MPSIRDKLADKKSKLATVPASRQDHPANLNDYQEGNFYTVDIDIITPDPDQPRKYFDPDALQDLTDSIRQKGILQPVIIRKDEAGKIILVAGERRLKAAIMAELKKIPAILTKGNPLEISIIENLQRQDLNPIEEAEALGKMVDQHEYTQEKLAFVIGKARSTVTEILTLNKLPEDVKEECRRADIFPRRLLIEIAKQDSPETMIYLFKKAKEGKLKSDQVRDIVRKRLGENRIHRTPAAIAFSRSSDLNTTLEKLDLTTIEQQEKDNLIMALKNLKVIIDKLLSNVGAPT